MRKTTILAGAILAALAGGCTESLVGTTRSLGQVPYPAAFAAAKEVMGQYDFLIESSDPVTGVIRSQPKAFQAPHERLIGGSPARKAAKFTLQEKGGEVVAYAAVWVERLGSAAQSRLSMSQEKYDSVPNQTPAEGEAATTAEQNANWTIDTQDRVTERRMLDDLYKRLHPEATKE